MVVLIKLISLCFVAVPAVCVPITHEAEYPGVTECVRDDESDEAESTDSDMPALIPLVIVQRLALPTEVVAAGGLDCLSVCHVCHPSTTTVSTTTVLVLLEDFGTLPSETMRCDGWSFCPNQQRSSCVVNVAVSGGKQKTLILSSIPGALNEVVSVTNSGFLDDVFAETEGERWCNGVAPLAWIHLLTSARNSTYARFGSYDRFNQECGCSSDEVGYLHRFLNEAQKYRLPANSSNLLPEYLRSKS